VKVRSEFIGEAPKPWCRRSNPLGLVHGHPPAFGRLPGAITGALPVHGILDPEARCEVADVAIWHDERFAAYLQLSAFSCETSRSSLGVAFARACSVTNASEVLGVAVPKSVRWLRDCVGAVRPPRRSNGLPRVSGGCAHCRGEPRRWPTVTLSSGRGHATAKRSFRGLPRYRRGLVCPEQSPGPLPSRAQLPGRKSSSLAKRSASWVWFDSAAGVRACRPDPTRRSATPRSEPTAR
jgi:hypothetical protein